MVKRWFRLWSQITYILQLDGLKDTEIYQKAKEYGNVIIISKDFDLDQIINLLGSPPKWISLKVGNCDNKILFAILKNNIEKAIRLILDLNQDIIEITPWANFQITISQVRKHLYG